MEFERTEFAHKAVKELNKEETEGMKVMELTAPPPKKTKPSAEDKKKASINVRPQLQPQRRFSHAGFGMGQGQGEARRKISLFDNMKFNPIMEEHNDQPQKKESFGLNPNAPSFSMQQYPQQ